MEARGTVTSGEAIEICQYWIKYKGLTPEQLNISIRHFKTKLLTQTVKFQPSL